MQLEFLKKQVSEIAEVCKDSEFEAQSNEIHTAFSNLLELIQKD